MSSTAPVCETKSATAQPHAPGRSAGLGRRSTSRADEQLYEEEAPRVRTKAQAHAGCGRGRSGLNSNHQGACRVRWRAKRFEFEPPRSMQGAGAGERFEFEPPRSMQGAVAD